MDIKLKVKGRRGIVRAIVNTAELLLLALFFVLDYLQVIHVPLSTTIPLLLFAWLSLRLRGMRWRDVGWYRPTNLGITALIALLSAVVMQFVSFFIVIPMASRILGSEIDLLLLDQLRGNPGMFLIGLVFVWTLAAFGEEFVYRGYLLNRFADFGGNSKISFIVALLLSSAVFGFVHSYQGTIGIIDTFISGLAAGALYLANGRKLWLPILHHGFYDTIALLLAFTGLI